MRSASEPGCAGCAATKRSAAVTKAAVEVFMAAAPRPYSLPARTLGSKGSECHFSRGPGGTTSVCPARTTSGLSAPWRIQRLVTAPHWNTSALKPSATRRSTMSCWQPASSGVIERRAMSALASSRVSLLTLVRRGAVVRRRVGGRAALHDRAHALLDVAAQPRRRAQQEEDLRANGDRAQHELHDALEERRLPPPPLLSQDLQP